MKKFRLFLFFLASISLFNCSSGGDTDNSVGSNISPSNANQMASVLVIPNSETINSSTLPASSDSSVAPIISHIDTNLSYTAGSQIFIPCDVLAPTQNNIAGVYIQVKGASTYFNVPIDAGTFNGLISLPIDLPAIVGEGTFILILKFYDTAGNISQEIEITITVTKPINCGTTKASGGEGLTSTIFKIPDGATGTIVISYDTFVVPDKIDVFQDGNWIAGTGFSTVRSTLRKALTCNLATEALGYVGEEGQFIFSYDAALGNSIEVVVSGCEDGGTAWEYDFSCPQEIVGMVVLDGTTYITGCESSNIDQTCSPQSIGVQMDNLDLHVDLTIKNMPQQSSGTFQLYSGTNSNSCSLMIAGNIGLGVTGVDFYTTSNISGSVTKTGPKSFTFTKSWTAYVTNISHTISGSGTYQ